MTQLSPSQITEWTQANPKTRLVCYTTKRRMAFGNAHYHEDKTPSGRLVSVAISVQGTAGTEVLAITDELCEPLNEYLRSISESLDGVG